MQRSSRLAAYDQWNDERRAEARIVVYCSVFRIRHVFPHRTQRCIVIEHAGARLAHHQGRSEVPVAHRHDRAADKRFQAAVEFRVPDGPPRRAVRPPRKSTEVDTNRRTAARKARLFAARWWKRRAWT